MKFLCKPDHLPGKKTPIISCRSCNSHKSYKTVIIISCLSGSIACAALPEKKRHRHFFGCRKTKPGFQLNLFPQIPCGEPAELFQSQRGQ